jgi:hypothetical protein
MGREIYIFKINSEKAKLNLISEIELNKKYSISLKDFIEDSNKGKSKYDISNYENIIETIKSDFSKIRTNELDNIFFWFINFQYEPNFRKEFGDTNFNSIIFNKLKECGIELVYEFQGKSVCFHFMYWLGEFEFINKLGLYNEHNDSFLTYEISTKTIKEYLDYVLLLMSKVELQKNEPWIEFKEMESELITNDNLLKQVLYTLERYNIEDEEFDTSYDVFHHAFEIRKKLKGDNSRIIIIDSY